MVYPDFENFEIKNENDEWQKLFQFRLDECKLEDFSEQVRKVFQDEILSFYLVCKIST